MTPGEQADNVETVPEHEAFQTGPEDTRGTDVRQQYPGCRCPVIVICVMQPKPAELDDFTLHSALNPLYVPHVFLCMKLIMTPVTDLILHLHRSCSTVMRLQVTFMTLVIRLAPSCIRGNYAPE